MNCPFCGALMEDGNVTTADSIGLFFMRNLPAAFLCFGISTFLGILIYLANLNERSRRQREELEAQQSAQEPKK